VLADLTTMKCSWAQKHR